MESLPTVRVAAVQAMPVVLDLQASLEKAFGLIADAAGQGAELVVFPETFLSPYPSYAWAHLPGGDGDALWERMWASSVEAPGPVVELCREGKPPVLRVHPGPVALLERLRHIAIESGAFVVSAPQYIQRAAFGDDFPWPLPDSEVFGRGGAAIAAPDGAHLPLRRADGRRRQWSGFGHSL